MAEQFDMEIYNNALKNGSYIPPQNSAPQNPAPNIVHMTEGLDMTNVEFGQFSDNSEKK